MKERIVEDNQRKTIMITAENHGFLHAKSKKFRVTQSVVIDALRSLVSEELLDAKLKDMLNSKGKAKATRLEKRREMAKLADHIDMDVINKLLADPKAIDKIKAAVGG